MGVLDICMKRGAVHSLLALAALLLAACVSDITAKTTATPPAAPKYLDGFTLIPDSEYTPVGRLLTHDGRLIGSGVLVHPRGVLTAAHCTDGERVYWFETNGKRYCVDSTRIHSRDIDLALLVLDEPCDEPCLPLPEHGHWVRRGEPLVAVGHGGGYRKRSNPGVFWYYGTLVQEPFALKMLCINGTIWFGDSGGAVVDNSGTLVGIVSSLGSRGGVVYENTAVLVEPFLPWIQSVLEDHQCN